MIHVIHDAAGRILRTQTGDQVLPGEAALPLPGGGSVNEDEAWVDGGALAPRPAPVLPATAAPGVVLDLSDLPPETALTVRNEAGQEATGTAGDGMTLADPGVYLIRAEPPWPWQAIDHRIEVA